MTDPARTRPAYVPLLGVLAVVWIGIVDIPVQIRAGGLSLSALMTIGLSVTALAIMIANEFCVGTRLRRERDIVGAFRRGTASVPLLLRVFAVYALVWVAVRPSMEGVQSVLCYFLFIASLVIVATSVYSDYGRIPQAMVLAGYLATVLSMATTLTGVRLVAGRSYGMTALILLAILIPRRDLLSRAIVPIGIVMVTLIASLSRTTTVVGMVLLLFLAVRARKGSRVVYVLAMLASVALMGLVVAVAVPDFVARFTEGDNATVAGVNFNTSGRANLWVATWESALDSPWLGNSPGHAAALMVERFPESAGQPHNDYLRIFDDLGVVGVVLWWGGILQLTVRSFRNARRHDTPELWTAAMVMVALMLVGTTDNIIVYQFIMVPIAVLVGLTLRTPTPPACADRGTAKGRASAMSATRAARSELASSGTVHHWSTGTKGWRPATGSPARKRWRWRLRTL